MFKTAKVNGLNPSNQCHDSNPNQFKTASISNCFGRRIQLPLTGSKGIPTTPDSKSYQSLAKKPLPQPGKISDQTTSLSQDSTKKISTSETTSLLSPKKPLPSVPQDSSCSSKPTLSNSNKPNNNLPLNIKTFEVVEMNEQESQENKKLIQEYVFLSVSLEKLKKCDEINKKLDLEHEASKRRIQALDAQIETISQNNNSIKNEKTEGIRNVLKTLMSRVFNVDPQIICSSISLSDLDNIIYDDINKRVIIKKAGIEKVVLPFLRDHQEITQINLTPFKNEIHDNALIILFESLKSTNITKIIIAKTLNDEEKQAQALVEKTLEKLGRKLTVVNKAS